MPTMLTSGLIPMPELPAAQLPRLRVFLTNLENQPHPATVSVSKLEGDTKVNILHEEVQVPGDDRVMLELETEVIEGQIIEVVATVPASSFLPQAFAVEPEIAVVTLFIGDGSTSLLQSVTAGEFVLV